MVEIRREVLIDREIAAKHGVMMTALTKLEDAVDGLHWTAKDKRVRRYGWTMNLEEVIAKLRASYAENPDEMYYGKSVDAKRSLDRYDETSSSYHVAEVAYREAEKKYEGWSRFFLVLNTDGHIHSSMNCSTCTYTTRFSWLIQYLKTERGKAQFKKEDTS